MIIEAEKKAKQKEKLLELSSNSLVNCFDTKTRTAARNILQKYANTIQDRIKAVYKPRFFIDLIKSRNLYHPSYPMRI